jgi:hypothetical protein
MSAVLGPKFSPVLFLSKLLLFCSFCNKRYIVILVVAVVDPVAGAIPVTVGAV